MPYRGRIGWFPKTGAKCRGGTGIKKRSIKAYFIFEERNL